MMRFKEQNNDPQGTTHEGQSSIREALGIITPLFLRHKKRLLAGFIAVIVVDLLQLIIPRFIKQGVDSLAQEGATEHSLFILAVTIFIAACIVAGFRFFWRYLLIGFSRILEKSVRDQLFRHILAMDQQFFGRWTTGDLIAHSSNDLNAIQMACGMGLVAASDAVFMSVAAICFMVAISGELTLYALFPMPFLALSTKYLSGHLHRRFNKVQEQFSQLTEFARNTIVSIRLIKAYTLEKLQNKQFDQLGREYVRSNLRVALIQGTMFPTATFVGNIGMLLVLYKGGTMVVNQQISLGDFVAFTTYLSLLIWPIMAVGWVTNVAQRGLTSLQRIQRLLSEQPKVKCQPQADLPEADQITFHCRNLSFTYPGEARQVLENVTLDITPGILGITGRTGSGKSTLCKVLLRMYPVGDGMLNLNEIDVNDLDIKYVRNHIAYVAQEPILFSHSISENITFGRQDATDEDVYKAARAAAIHEDILRLPGGYDAVIGERGVKLSGGQRQRLALARALLCDRPMLVIDDGLNAIDVETEQQVLLGIHSAFQNKTVVIVSHRVNVLETADCIVVMENGKIAAQGTHDELLAQPLYKVMVSKQQNNAR